MENEAAGSAQRTAPDDLVPQYGRPLMAADPVRWLDGRYTSFSGVPLTRPQRALDYRVLQIISRTHVDHDNDLAAKLGVDPTDRDFRTCLERIATKGCLIRKIHEWHYSGKWVPIDNPSFTLTAAGDHLAHEKCPED